MTKYNVLEKARNLLHLIYIKLVRIDDNPHKVAIGFGLGVFAGIMPFAGPLFALFLAMLFKVNRLSALLGGFITNTWISLLAFFFSISVGSFVFGIDGDLIRSRWMALLKDFHISSLFKMSAFEIILPVVTGYFVIAFFSAIAAYAVIFILLKFLKNRKRT